MMPVITAEALIYFGGPAILLFYLWCILKGIQWDERHGETSTRDGLILALLWHAPSIITKLLVFVAALAIYLFQKYNP